MRSICFNIQHKYRNNNHNNNYKNKEKGYEVEKKEGIIM